VTPGLDVVAKLAVTALPLEPGVKPFDAALVKQTREVSDAQMRQLLVDAPSRGYLFCHDSSWYVTSEQRERMSLRLLEGSSLLAHCNLTSMPTRTAAEPKGLGEFEREVCTALGDNVQNVAAASEWTTAAGNRCLGVFVNGIIEEAPIQWRYYHVSNDGGAQATVSVTVEQSLLEQFADADRALIDSIELVDAPLEVPLIPPPREEAVKLDPPKPLAKARVAPVETRAEQPAEEPTEESETAVLEIGATKKK
jgi:hypothetical protein